MNQLISGSISNVKMTSLEISELVESRHDDVKRSIERLTNKGVIELPPTAEISTSTKPMKVYLFVGTQGKRDSFVVVAQLSPEFTARIVDRWQELESVIATQLPASNLMLAELMLAELKQQAVQTVQNTADIQHINATRRAEHWQIKQVHDAVHAKAKWFSDEHQVAYAVGVSKTWVLLKNHFAVSTYHALLAAQIDEALSFIDDLRLGHLAAI